MTGSQCERCLNYLGGLKCMAYKKKIPVDIIMNKIKHSKPIKGQQNDIVFEAKNDQ